MYFLTQHHHLHLQQPLHLRHLSPTYASSVEDAGQDQHDVVGPVLLVDGHLVLLDHQDVEVSSAVHGVEQVEQAVLVAPRGGHEDGALDAVGALRSKHNTGTRL